jgi:ArsR family transcriptional regulator
MKQENNEKSDQEQIFQMQCQICKALAHPQRMAIANCLKDKELAAGDLIAALGISKVNLSKNIAMMIHAGIVESRRDGRQILYRLTDPGIQEACSIMSSVIYRRLKRGEKLASAIRLNQGDLVE